MNIVVCIKYVPDWEAPASQFRIEDTRLVPAPGIAYRISDTDDEAIEAALRLKEQHGGRVTAISLGPAAARDGLKHALAMGCDQAILLDDPAFEDSDAAGTAAVLAAAIRKLGDVDLILTGRQAADWDQGQVHAGIAELLGLPAVIPDRHIEWNGSEFIVHRIYEEGYEEIAVKPPCVIACSNEIAEPRYPTLRGIMTASRAQIPVWTAADLGIDPGKVGRSGRLTRVLRLYAPQVEAKCEFIEGESPEEIAARLVQRLREEKLL